MGLGQEALRDLIAKLVKGEIVLPDIQREYVWAGSQIPRLLDSLQKGWPVGSVLLWNTSLEIPTKPAVVTQGQPTAVQPAILLDGQQRLSTIARVMHPELIAEGQKASDVRYHPGKEEFLTANAVNKKDPHWLPMSAILRDGAQFRDLLKPLNLPQEQEDAWTDRLSNVAHAIRSYIVPVQSINVDDYEVAAEIFNRVNTGGTRLSKGDLIMGAMAARWPQGRTRIEAFERAIGGHGWGVNREVLLRITSVIAMKSPNHIRLVELKSAEDWEAAWGATEKCVLDAIDFFLSHAKIPTSSLLPTEYVALVPAVLFHEHGHALEPGEADALARWVSLASAFGHYSGSLETRLAADVNLIRADVPSRLARVERLSVAAQDPRTPGTQLQPSDLFARTKQSPFLKLLQLRATQIGAESWISNRAITWDPAHKGVSVEVHHVFPKSWMRTHGAAGHPEVDTLANFAFLSKWDNIQISADDPADYLAKADPSVLEAQWIPLDPALWRVERFSDFCAARRELLAGALNEMLGLTRSSNENEPVGGDETPEPEVGAWIQDADEGIA